MRPARSRVADYAVYLILRLFICLVQTLSPTAARRLAAGLARLVYHFDRRHRQVVRDNLRQAFPGRWNEEALEKVVCATYRHFCTMLIEIAFLPRKFHANNFPRYLGWVNEGQREELIYWLRSSRPVLLLCAHFGNWEMASYNMGVAGYPIHAVARPLDNPYVDEFVRRFRQQKGQKFLAKNGDLDRMEALLESGAKVGMLADQDAGPRGVFVNFFGRPASTHKAIALLSLKHQAPILVLGTRKVGEPMRYQRSLRDVILPEEYARHPDPVRAITQRYSSALERMIYFAPDQYFWFHRRWKSQPQKARRRAA